MMVRAGVKFRGAYCPTVDRLVGESFGGYGGDEMIFSHLYIYKPTTTVHSDFYQFKHLRASHAFPEIGIFTNP